MADYRIEEFHKEMKEFARFGKPSAVSYKKCENGEIPVYSNEFWTAKQRAAHSLHEISYRGCFKPQLPRFFIERFTTSGERVYDPFMGRGTTLIESGLLGRIPVGCDINPLSILLARPRLSPINLDTIKQRLDEIDMSETSEIRQELDVFYHPDTLKELCGLKEYFLRKERERTLDHVDAWIRMVATNRLTGHSPGFFSVYTLPPNQAASIASQRRINEKSQQAAVKKDIRKIILKKSGTLLKDLSTEEKETLERGATHSQFLVRNCEETPEIPDESIHLVVTSPPFLDIVQYDQDNWLRCWFNGIDPKTVPIWQLRKEDDWQNAMSSVFQELNRVLVPNGIVAFEVGEIRNGKILMEDLVLPAAISSGLQPFAILINGQKFTKTSNCWGVDNALKGTNTNRVVLFQKTLDLQRTNWNFSDKQPKNKE